MQVTIDNITMQRITLDADDVKNAIKHFLAVTIHPKISNTDMEKAKVTMNPAGGALVEIIIDSVPDMPDQAPPCIETPGGPGPMHPDQIMKNLEQGFSKNQLADKED